VLVVEKRYETILKDKVSLKEQITALQKTLDEKVAELSSYDARKASEIAAI